MMISAFLVAAVVMASLAAEPQAAGPRPAAPAGIFPARPSQPDRNHDRVQGTPVETKPKTRIVCGMVVVEADPKIDPKIAWGDKGARPVNPDPKIAWPVRQCADK